MDANVVGPVPAAIERVKTVKFLIDDDNSASTSGPTREISDEPLDFVPCGDAETEIYCTMVKLVVNSSEHFS